MSSDGSFNDVKTNDTSKYNEGLLQIQRLHNIYLRCQTLSVADNLVEWHFELQGVWRELSRDALKLNPIHQQKIKVFDDHINSCFGFENGIGSVETVIKDRIKLRKLLMEKEIYLRNIQDLCGKGGSYKDESSEDWE
jgi:hypothetical protein